MFESKQALRRGFLAARRSVGFDADAAARQVLGMFGADLLVASYSALAFEPSAASLPVGALPRLLPDGDLELVPVRPGEALRPGLLGTTEPAGPAVPWSAVDLIVVPALAVSVTGVRLGRGGGSYDRALTRIRPGVPVVALLAFDAELVASLPREPHDVRVTHVARPSGLEEVGDSRR